MSFPGPPGIAQVRMESRSRRQRKLCGVRVLLPGRSPACLWELSPENRQASAERAAQMLARVASEREAVPRADGPREEGRRERKLRKRSEKPLKCEESPLQETGVQLELRGFSNSSKPRYPREG